MPEPETADEPSEESFQPYYRRIYESLKGPEPVTYQTTTSLILRGLGALYLVAFSVVIFQIFPLIGSEGLYPVDWFLSNTDRTFWDIPSLFWFINSDTALLGLGVVGWLTAAAVTIRGGSLVAMLALYILYLSYVNVGQIFYGYGWESQLLEMGFLGILLAPWRPPQACEAQEAPRPVIWLYRWTTLKVMLGAGLIKIRGDSCWTDLTCLDYHFETQPIPNPLSWYFHHLPDWLQKAGVGFNHLAELVAPFGVFGPRRLRHTAGIIIIGFQGVLILSGNLSFLNWLTIVGALSCFDDHFFSKDVPKALQQLPRPTVNFSASRRWLTYAIVFAILIFSITPAINMASSRQVMNEAYDPLHVINTYGAFGAVGETRREIVIKGTRKAPSNAQADDWRAYRFPCKPGPVTRRPCQISPYHLRLDWQLWFAPMAPLNKNPWLIHLVWKLLNNPEPVGPLIERNPFPKKPPEYIKIDLYEYKFTEASSAEAWWQRRKIGSYMKPVSTDNRSLQQYLRRRQLID